MSWISVILFGFFYVVFLVRRYKIYNQVFFRDGLRVGSGELYWNDIDRIPSIAMNMQDSNAMRYEILTSSGQKLEITVNSAQTWSSPLIKSGQGWFVEEVDKYMTQIPDKDGVFEDVWISDDLFVDKYGDNEFTYQLHKRRRSYWGLVQLAVMMLVIMLVLGVIVALVGELGSRPN